MNKHDLFIMKCGFKTVYDHAVEMDISKDGTPYIRGFYRENGDDLSILKAFLYINGRWVDADYKTLKPIDSVNKLCNKSEHCLIMEAERASKDGGL